MYNFSDIQFLFSNTYRNLLMPNSTVIDYRGLHRTSSRLLLIYDTNLMNPLRNSDISLKVKRLIKLHLNNVFRLWA